MSRSQQVTGTVETKIDYGDPPQISVAIPRLRDVSPEYKSWESIELLTDVLLLVVTDEEFLSCYAFLHNVFKSRVNGLGHVYFGEIGDGPDKVTISLVRCSRGSSQVSAAQNIVRSAVDVLKPKAVFSVGCCAGLQREQTKLGDVIISGKLLTFGDKKIVNDKPQWDGRRLDVSPKIGRLIKSAADGWDPPLKDPEARCIKVHCSGEILSGAELANSPTECEELIRQFPRAIAIEPEGQGVYSAAFDRQTEWVVIKGISHYADGGQLETEEWRRFSSAMAASVVNHIMKEPDILKDWPHYEGMKSAQIYSERLCTKLITKEGNEASTSGALNRERLSQNVIITERNETITDGASTKGVSSPVMVSDIPSLVMQNICRLLNVKSTVGYDFETLAGELGMKTGHVRLVSQTENPTEEVLKWWMPQKSATVEAFREILKRMQRHDALAVLDEEKQLGVSSPVMVSDIPYAVMKKIRRALNVKSAVDNDFRALAGELGMETSDVRLLSQKDDPTDEVLKWWEPQKSATVKQFREILKRIKRPDVLAIIDEGEKAEF